MLNIKVLVVDDEEIMHLVIKDALLKIKNIYSDYSFTCKQGLEKLNNEDFDVILLDFKLPDMNGFEFIEKAKKENLVKRVKIILMSQYGDLDTGKEAIQKGCFDYIEKPFNIGNLIFRIQRAVEHIELNEKIKILSKSFEPGFENIIGNSEKIKNVLSIVKKISNKNTTVLIEGETGTGKGLIAKAIHKNSKQKDNIFIPVNCGALAETLLESAFFGYEKGAFTGAVTKKYGILETANNGTVFFDEINNASMNMQFKLLRFIETGEFSRVGGNKIIYSNARIIAASNQKLEDLIKDNKFREDLYHRLNVVKIVIPPLRDRKEDIPLLINHFLKIYNKKFNKQVIMYKTALNYLIRHYWPGNIRQLENLIQSLALLNETGIIKPEDLPGTVKKENIFANDNPVFKKIKEKVITDFEIKFFKNLLKQTKGNVSKTSKIIKLSRTNLIKKLNAYKINALEYK